MGWTTFSMHQPIKEWFKSHIENGGMYEVLDCALVHRTTMYGAIKNVKTGEVICAVYLINWTPKAWHNFGYKDMTEFSGPCERDCPERIFKLLTPLTGDDNCTIWAQRWRDDVKKLHTKRKELKKLGHCIIKLKTPIRFTNGVELNHIKKVGRVLYAGVLYQGEFVSRFRASLNLTNYEYNVVEKNMECT